MLVLSLVTWPDLANSTEIWTSYIMCFVDTGPVLCRTWPPPEEAQVSLLGSETPVQLVLPPQSTNKPINRTAGSSQPQLACQVAVATWFQPPPFGAEVNFPSSNCQPTEFWKKKKSHDRIIILRPVCFVAIIEGCENNSFVCMIHRKYSGKCPDCALPVAIYCYLALLWTNHFLILEIPD